MNYECGDYTVNDDGTVEFNNVLLQPTINKHGYYQLIIDDKPITVHQLIFKLLEIELQPGQVIGHIDNNKLDNSLSNLMPMTKSEVNRNAFNNRNSDEAKAAREAYRQSPEYYAALQERSDFIFAHIRDKKPDIFQQNDLNDIFPNH